MQIEARGQAPRPFPRFPVVAARADRGAGPEPSQQAAVHWPAVARLVVAIDEFATLRAELPEFLDALVGVAQRGRSLGVHLILATQRPAGVVSEHIRANTNIRIALRVQDGADSRDVIDRPDAAALDRRRPGRALVRLGRDEVLAVQTAFSGARSMVAGPSVRPVPPSCRR